MGSAPRIPNGRAGKWEISLVVFEPTPLRNYALNHRFRPLGQSVLSYTAQAGATEPNSNSNIVEAHVKRATPTLLS